MGKVVFFSAFLIIFASGFIRPGLAQARPGLDKTVVESSGPLIFTSKINQLLPEPQAGLLNGILFGEKRTSVSLFGEKRTSVSLFGEKRTSVSLFGEKAHMGKDFFNQLKRTGTLHVVALSGMNISILISLVGQLTMFLGRRKSIIISFIIIIIFINFVGVSASVVRAGLMGSLTLLSIWTGRRDWALLSLVFAAGVMLIFNLQWIFDLGFQLSFLATMGIILLGGQCHPELVSGSVAQEKRMSNSASRRIQHNVLGSLKTDLQTTLSAQLFTAPVLLYNFENLSLVSPLTNVLVGWVVAPIMVLGLILSLLSIFSLGLAQPLAWAIWVPLTYFVKVIEITSKIPFASISF